jgi:hypothetical protein
MSGVRNVSSIREVAIFTVAIAVKAVVCATNEGMFGAMNYFQLFKAPHLPQTGLSSHIAIN